MIKSVQNCLYVMLIGRELYIACKNKNVRNQSPYPLVSNTIPTFTSHCLTITTAYKYENDLIKRELNKLKVCRITTYKKMSSFLLSNKKIAKNILNISILFETTSKKYFQLHLLVQILADTNFGGFEGQEGAKFSAHKNYFLNIYDPITLFFWRLIL